MTDSAFRRSTALAMPSISARRTEICPPQVAQDMPSNSYSHISHPSARSRSAPEAVSLLTRRKPGCGLSLNPKSEIAILGREPYLSLPLLSSFTATASRHFSYWPSRTTTRSSSKSGLSCSRLVDWQRRGLKCPSPLRREEVLARPNWTFIVHAFPACQGTPVGCMAPCVPT